MALFRGIADDVPLQVWLEQHIWPREGALRRAGVRLRRSRLAAAEMLRGGITCCNDMYFFPDATARALLAAGMRAMLGLPVLDFPTPYAADPTATCRRGSPSATPSSTSRGSPSRWRRTRRTPSATRRGSARSPTRAQLDLPIQTHLAETADEVAREPRDRTARHRSRGCTGWGATGPRFIAIHAVHLDAADIDLLATHGGHVVHCPASNMKLGCGIAPVAGMPRRGINVALGTDGAASNNRLDLFGEMRLAALLAKVATGDPAALPAADVLRAATLGGARALGLDADIGSLVPGKLADVGRRRPLVARDDALLRSRLAPRPRRPGAKR